MKKKITKGTFWGSVGVTLVSLLGSLSLLALAPGAKAVNLSPPPRESVLDGKKSIKNTQPTSEDLKIQQKSNDWVVTGLTDVGKEKSEITVPDGVTVIGVDSFKNNSNLKKVTLPDGLISIEHDAFDGCSNLEEAIIPNSVTSLGERVFFSCNKLTESNIPRNIKSAPRLMFYETNLKNLFIPSQVFSVGKSFSSWAYEKKTFSNIFVMSSNIELELYSFCVASSDYYAQKETPWLYAWTINSGVQGKLKDCTGSTSEDPKDYCKMLAPNNVNILESSGDVYYCKDEQSKVVYMAGLTHQGRSATEVTVPSNIKKIPEFVFTESYSNLKKIVIESDNINFEKYSLFGVPKDVDYYVRTKEIAQKLFDTCHISKEHIYFDSTTTNFVEATLFSSGCDKILGLTVAGKRLNRFTIPQNVTYIGANAFRGHTNNIERITFQNDSVGFDPHALDDVDTDAVYYVDGNDSCQTIASLKNTSTVIDTNIYLSSQNDHDLVVRNRIDNNAKALVGLTDSGKTKTELSIPSDITGIDSDAFNNATNPIDKITFENGSQLGWIGSDLLASQKLSQTKYVFDVSDNSRTQTLQQKGVSGDRIILVSNQFEVNINGILTGIRLASGQQNQKNTTIVIPKNIGEVNIVGIGSNAFINYPNVLRIEFSDGANLVQGKISSDAFGGLVNNPVVYVYSDNNAKVLLNATTELEIGVGDSKSDIFTSFQSPAKFDGLTSLGVQQNQLDLPENINWIGPYAFFGCSSSLREITIESDSLHIDDGAFDVDPIKSILNNIKFYVSNDRVKTELKEHNIKGNNIYVPGSPNPSVSSIFANPLLLQNIGIIVGTIVLAIIILGLSIGLPMRKQHKIVMLRAMLNGKGIQRLARANQMAFRKLIEANSYIHEEILGLKNGLNESSKKSSHLLSSDLKKAKNNKKVRSSRPPSVALKNKSEQNEDTITSLYSKFLIRSSSSNE